MIDSIRVGAKIASLRKTAKMSQDQLAGELFITRQALSKWETGAAVPPLEMVLALSRILHVSFEDILCLDEEISVDPDNIFAGHAREFVITQIVSGKLAVDLPSVFYQFSPSERLLVLREIREGRLDVDISELESRLSLAELKYLGGNYNDSQKDD
jgi:transcriptional regulator with XRE-family HTH domain